MVIIQRQNRKKIANLSCQTLWLVESGPGLVEYSWLGEFTKWLGESNTQKLKKSIFSADFDQICINTIETNQGSDTTDGFWP